MYFFSDSKYQGLTFFIKLKKKKSKLIMHVNDSSGFGVYYAEVYLTGIRRSRKMSTRKQIYGNSSDNIMGRILIIGI